MRISTLIDSRARRVGMLCLCADNSMVKMMLSCARSDDKSECVTAVLDEPLQEGLNRGGLTMLTVMTVTKDGGLTSNFCRLS